MKYVEGTWNENADKGKVVQQHEHVKESKILWMSYVDRPRDSPFPSLFCGVKFAAAPNFAQSRDVNFSPPPSAFSPTPSAKLDTVNLG